MSDTPWVAIIVAAVAAIPGVLAFVGGRRKSNADAAERIATAAANTVDMQQDRLNAMEEELKSLRPLRDEVAKLRSELNAATSEILKLNRALIQANERIKVLESENADLRRRVGEC